jgi:hypothetical protein
VRLAVLISLPVYREAIPVLVVAEAYTIKRATNQSSSAALQIAHRGQEIRGAGVYCTLLRFSFAGPFNNVQRK